MILSGILLTPTGVPYKNSPVRITANNTSPSVLMFVQKDFKTDVDGAYEIDVPNGWYHVSVFSLEYRSYVNIGNIEVTDETTETTLNELLMLDQTAHSDGLAAQVAANAASALASKDAAAISETQAAASATSASSSATNSQSSATASASSAELANTAATTSTTAASEAEASASFAQSAAESAMIQTGIYATEALGRTAVADGQDFRVQGDNVTTAILIYRRIDANTSTFLTSISPAEALSILQRLVYPLLSNKFSRDCSEHPFVIDKGDKRLLSLHNDGGVDLGALALSLVDSPRITGYSGQTVVWKYDTAGIPFQIIWVDSQGRPDFIPSPNLLSRLSAAPFFPLTDVRGSYAVSNVRKTDTYNIATVQDKGRQVYDGLQLRSGSLDTLVVRRSTPIEFIPVVGQSNAGGAGTGVTAGPKLTTAQWPHTVLSFNSAKFQFQGSNGLIDGSTLTDLAPLYDPATPLGQYPATMQGFAWATQQSREGLAQTGIVSFTAWQGDTPASGFLNGTTNWTNLMTSTTRAVACSAQYSRSVETQWITRVQGEAGANYSADYVTWADAVKPAIRAITGQLFDPKIALWQIVGVSPDNGVGKIQLDHANSRADTELVGVMYPYQVSDVQHLTAESRMMQGDVYSDFRLQIARGKTWTPLQMLTAVRVGQVVTITLALPPGVSAVSKCVDWPPQVAQDGFVYRDSLGDTPISSITYSGSTITLTLSTTPSGSSGTVRYGLDAGPGIAGWYQLAGNVCGISRTKSAYYEQGFNVAEYVRHYLARYSISVT